MLQENETSIKKASHWLNNLLYTADALRDYGTLDDGGRIDHLLWPYVDFMDELIRKSREMKPKERRGVTICGPQFSITRQDDKTWPVPAYSIIPAGDSEPINISLIQSAHQIYSDAYFKMIKLFGNQEKPRSRLSRHIDPAHWSDLPREPSLPGDFDNPQEVPPSPFSIEIPTNWQVWGIPVRPESWVCDFGIAVFRFPMGRSGLTGRFEGHPKHEAVHRAIAIKLRYLDLSYLMHHPYLNEGIADAIALLDHQPADYFQHDFSQERNPNLREYSIGTHLTYYSALTVNDLLHPLGFYELDGKGKFVSELYIPRFILATFIAILASSYKNYPNDGLKDEEAFLEKLNIGINNLFNPSSYTNSVSHSGIYHLVNSLKELDLLAKSGEKITGDTFWQVLTGDKEITELEIEKYYKRSAAIFMPLYVLYKQVSGGIRHINWWNSQPQTIQDLLRIHAPKISTPIYNQFRENFKEPIVSLPKL